MVKKGLWDAHMHTAFSGDCDEDAGVMIQTAKDMGLSGVTITDHLDLDYRSDPGLFDLDLDGYVPAISQLKEKHGDKDFGVLVGLELGLQPHLKKRHQNIIKEYAFDFVIGSIHVVDGIDPYYDEFFSGRDVRKTLIGYLDCVIENLNAYTDFDSLGHLDYIVRYAAKRYGYEASVISTDDEEYRKRLIAIFEILMKRDLALEVNTGSFRGGMTVPNPSYDILRLYRQLGGSRITLGADAHRKEDIAIAFGEVREGLLDLGFTEYSVYEGRKPKEYAL